MKTFINLPAQFMLRLKYPQKFAVIGVLFLLPLCLVLFYFQNEVNTGDAFALKERDGVTYCAPVLKLLQDVVRHENLVVEAKLQGGASVSAAAACEGDIAADISAIDLADSRLGASLGASQSWNAIKEQWNATRLSGGSAASAIAAHVALAQQICSFLTTVGTNSNLILDPDVDSYYTMDSLITQIPALAVSLGEARDTAELIAARHASTEPERTRIAVLSSAIQTATANLSADMQQAGQANHAVKNSIGSIADTQALALGNFEQAASAATRLPRPAVSATAVRDAAESASADSIAYTHAGLPALDSLIAKRSAGFKARRDFVDISTLVFVSIAICLFVGFYRAMMIIASSVRQAADVLRSADIDGGESRRDRIVRVAGHDELAQVVNELIETLGEPDAKLQARFDGMVSNLAMLVRETALAADDIVVQAQEVATAADDLAQRTSDNSNNIDETAASFQQMTASVTVSTDNARQADGLAETARRLAEQGVLSARKAVDAVGEIRNVSRQIADVISTIDDLSFQTNLLALNASVEAARVGDAGRGFAVVADEVRKLAVRSSASAREIKSLSAQIASRVETGNALVNESGDRLSAIVESVTRVADAVEQIAHGLEEQQAGIEQVNAVVTHMDKATQQNAALAEQFAACSRGMSDRSRSMKELVMQFDVSGRSNPLNKAA